VTSPNPAPEIEALQRVLACQHAAVYAYSVIGVHLSDPGQVSTVRSLQAAHQATRDQLMADLTARSVTPAPPAPTYSPAQPVTDAASAHRWALQLENDCAAAYRYLLTVTASMTGSVTALRQLALAGLTGSAQSSLTWRALVTPATPTVPFPGT
jgi:hypothetical protein